MADTEIEKRAREGIDAFNRADWEAVRVQSGPGFVYEETGTGRRLEGADATLAVFEEWRTALPDLAGEIAALVSDDGVAVLELLWRGTHTGPLATPAGVVPPSGRRVEMRSTMWQYWRDGLLVFERNHVDVLTMLTQIGALGP